jgi:cell division protein FtsX
VGCDNPHFLRQEASWSQTSEKRGFSSATSPLLPRSGFVQFADEETPDKLKAAARRRPGWPTAQAQVAEVDRLALANKVARIASNLMLTGETYTAKSSVAAE